MTKLLTINTSEAEAAFVVSSTPEFLITKLSRLEGTRFLAANYSSDAIYEAIQTAIAEPPKDVGELVKPLLLLVALSRHGDREFLRRELGKTPLGYQWYREVVSLLDSDFTTFRDIRIPPRLIDPKAPPLETTTLKIILPRK